MCVCVCVLGGDRNSRYQTEEDKEEHFIVYVSSHGDRTPRRREGGGSGASHLDV